MTSPTFIERLEASGVGREILEKEQAETLARRRQLVKELAKITAEHEAALPALIESEEKAAAKVRRAEEAFEAAQASHRAALYARVTAANSLESARGPLVGELLASAPREIDAFIAEMRDLFEKTRRLEISSPPMRPGVFGGIDPDDVAAADAAYQNLTSRLARIRSAIPEAEALKLEALDSKELAERLDGLRQTTTAEGK